MKKNILLFITIILVSVSCAHSAKFTLIEKGYKVKGAKIAVIAATKNNATMAVAHYMTESLKKQTRFKVTSQERVAKLLKKYPQEIQGPYRSAYMNINEDYSKTAVESLKEIQRKLNVDYLYVVWIPVTVKEVFNYELETIHLHTINQFFEFPSGKEIAHSKFKMMYLIKGKGMMVARSLEEAAEKWSKDVVAMIAQKLNMKKTKLL